MGLQICVLGSGSSGNCTFIRSGETAILLDAGLSARETEIRLGQIGASLSQIRAICVSHEHNDHIAGLGAIHRRGGMPLYANSGTIEGLRADPKNEGLVWQVFSNGAPFQVGELVIDPFSVPHDAYDPVGFVVSDGRDRIGIVTDIGMPTSLVRERLKGCRTVVVESNHDEQMVRDASRPWRLKQRILGRQGHLSNEHAATMLAEIAGTGLEQIFLAHLSRDCNRHDLALKTAQQTLLKAGLAHIRVSLTYAEKISEVWTAQP